jgi:HK97 family phage major capsid protein
VKITEGGTATNGSLRPLLTPALNAGGAVSTSLFGLPVLVTPNAAAGTALLIAAPELIFVKRTDVEQLADPYSLSTTYQTRLRTVVRAGFYAIPQRFVRVGSLA